MAASIWVGVDDAARIGRFADGTSAAPSITFASDTDLGLYRVGTNALGLVADTSVGIRKPGGNRYFLFGYDSTGSFLQFIDRNNDAIAVNLTSDAANTLALRNGTNAQAFRVYNTYTDASNYERAIFGWNANVLQIGTASAGTGSARGIAFIGDYIQVSGLPTADPAVAGRLWNDAGTVKVSAG